MDCFYRSIPDPTLTFPNSGSTRAAKVLLGLTLLPYP